ncbi:MAG: FAD-binding oxidoreductase [Gemmatimonadaceae bacterium]
MPLAVGGLVSHRPVWDDGVWTPLPTLGGDVEADVCVVGLGGAGLACVRQLLELGQRVVGLDAGAIGGGAAGRNGGFLLAGLASFYHDAVSRHGHERARDVYRLTLREIDRMEGETPECVRRAGSLRIASSAEEDVDCAQQLEAMRADGLPAELYSGLEGTGILVPTDCSFQPLARCRTLAGRAIADGARLFEWSRAEGVTGREIRTAHGRVRCHAVIVAVDGRLERVLPELVPVVRTARLQMLATAPASDVCYPRPVYARYGYDYWQQLEDERIVLGGFRDRGGDDEWTHDSDPTEMVQRELDAFLRDALGVTAPVTHRWGAAVSYHRTGLPLAAEVRDRVWAVGAYCGTGNVLGSMLGRAIARAAVLADAATLRIFAA